jgi:TolB-like protein/Tfp pilus assembly protein PilF
VTEDSLNSLSKSDQEAIRQQLDRILGSGPFHQSRRRQRFLEYIVTETLAGRGERLKGYNVALAVFDRPETFDPHLDPIVRVEAARVREKLREYYEDDGHGDPIRIELPKGTYTPHIEFRQVASPPWPDLLDATISDRPSDPSHVSVASQPRSRKTPFGVLAAFVIVVLLVMLAGFSAWRWWVPSTPLSEKSSIAVLPFKSIGNDPKWDRFADGITEDIVTDLSHSKDLFVVARNSTEVYRGKPVDVRNVGRDLGVRYVLEGSIQSINERIRVSAQLIEADSGGHIWSERYDRPVDDLFAVQNDVTQRIAATIAGSEGAVAEAERTLLRRKPPVNLTAFDTYLLAIEAKHKVTREGLSEAESLFRKAIELDPHMARAYYGLATVQMYLIDLGLAPSVDEALSTMMDEAEKAVELDPDDGKAHLALGGAYAYQGKAQQALAEFDRAETLSPSDADLLLVIAWSIPAFGETERAVNLAERALKLNPHYPDWYNRGLGYVFFFGEQYDKSVKYRLLVKEPAALDYAFLAMAYAYLGRTGDAEAAAANVKNLDPTWIAERYLSEAGGYAEKEAQLFVNGARMAGVPACMPADKLEQMPNLIRVKSCDQQRTTSLGDLLGIRAFGDFGKFLDAGWDDYNRQPSFATSLTAFAGSTSKIDAPDFRF